MMKAGERPNSKLLRGGRQDSRRFRLLAVVVGFFIVSLTFVLVSKPDAILFGREFPFKFQFHPYSFLGTLNSVTTSSSSSSSS